MGYKIPTDIPLVATEWRDWPLSERLAAVAKLDDIPSIFRVAAVATSLNEQPGSTPNGNCCGLMCQGTTFPWGWKAEQWTTRPIGYALIREGQTGKTAPFLAFAKPDDSLEFLVNRCAGRGITNGIAYAKLWVSAEDGTPTFNNAVFGFDRAHRKVLTHLLDKCH